MFPVHPGRILKREFSLDTALRLARFFGNSARFWLNLQTSYELAVGERDILFNYE